jgi:hypothetical protein
VKSYLNSKERTLKGVTKIGLLFNAGMADTKEVLI